jgi:DNA-binding transcriptional regulator YhcF (GntR family)
MLEKSLFCAIISITRQRKELTMIIEVDFDSDEAIYIQLCNQIIMGIATSVIHEGDSLPSVRQLADTIGVNMHTVNKAYSVLKREGYISLDKRRGAVIALDIDKMEQLEEMRRELKIVLARGCCKNISRREVHDLVDEIFDDYE